MAASNTNTPLNLNSTNFTSAQPRQRNSVLGGTSPLTNSANPFSGIFSARLPSSIMTTMAGGRRQSISRHTSNPGIADNTSTDGLLEGAEAGASSSAPTAPIPASEANTESEVPATSISQGGWNNWGMMSNIPHLPTPAAIQRAARRAISSRGVGRSVGNRRPITAPPRSNSTSGETTTTTNVDDLLGLLAAMEEAVDEAEISAGLTNRNRNRLGSVSTPAVSTSNINTTTTEPTPSTSGTSRNDIQNRLSEDTKQTDSQDQAATVETETQRTSDQVEASAADPPVVTSRVDDDVDSDGAQDEVGATAPTNDNANPDSEEENQDDPYWSGVLWQLPVLCLVLLCKYLQHYFGALVEVLLLAFVFHYYNMVVKLNVVSHKAISIGYRKCVCLMFTKMKKSFTQFCLRGRAPPAPINLLHAAANNSDNPAATELTLVSNNPESLFTDHPEVSVVMKVPGTYNPTNAIISSDANDAYLAQLNNKTESPEPKVFLGLGEETKSSQKVHFTNVAPEDSDEDVPCVVQVNPTYSEKDAKAVDNSGASTSQASTSQSSTSQVSTSQASTSQASTSQASTSQASTSQASTSQASTSQASTSQASTSQASTSQASTSSIKVPGSVTIDIETDEPHTVEVDLSDDVSKHAMEEPKNNTDNPTENAETNADNAETNADENAASGEDATVQNPPRTVQMNSALLESLNISEEETQAQESVLCVLERLRLLLMTLLMVPMAVYIFYGFLWEKYAVYWCLLFQPPTVPPYLLPEVLWLTLVLDYLARIITAWLKGWIVIFIWMQRNSFLIHKGRYFPVIEMVSQLYRSFLPIIPWFFYIYASYAYYAQEELNKSVAAVADSKVDTTAKPDISNTLKTLQMLYDHYKSQLNESDFNTTESDLLLEPGFRTTVDPGLDEVTGVSSTTYGPSLLDSELNRVTFTTKGVTAHQLIGLALFVAYLLHKKLDVVARVTNVWQAVKALKTNSGSYGTKPSKCELESSGGKCPICHDQYRMPILLKCSHIFCESCIVQWFQRERICPMCRAQIADDPMWKDGSTSQMFQII